MHADNLIWKDQRALSRTIRNYNNYRRFFSPLIIGEKGRCVGKGVDGNAIASAIQLSEPLANHPLARSNGHGTKCGVIGPHRGIATPRLDQRPRPLPHPFFKSWIATHFGMKL